MPDKGTYPRVQAPGSRASHRNRNWMVETWDGMEWVLNWVRASDWGDRRH